MSQNEDQHNTFFSPEQRQVIDGLLAINELDIEGELRLCAGHYNHFAQLAADADLLAEQITLKREVREAQLTQQLRTAALEEAQQTSDNDGDKKKKTKLYTGVEKEADLKRAALRDEIWIALKQKEIQSYYTARILNKAAQAFEMKSRMLQSLNRRQSVGQTHE